MTKVSFMSKLYKNNLYNTKKVAKHSTYNIMYGKTFFISKGWRPKRREQYTTRKDSGVFRISFVQRGIGICYNSRRRR